MRPIRFAFAITAALALACNTLLPRAAPTPTVAPTEAVAPTPAVPPTAAATPTLARPSDLYIGPGDVAVHPDTGIYSGDRVSFEVFPRDGANIGLENFPVAMYWGETQLAFGPAERYGLGGRLQATFAWVWDTAGLAGPQTITVVLDPQGEIRSGDEIKDNNTLTFTVNVLPRNELPVAQREAEWITAESDCCAFNYITGSAAERDIETIRSTAESAIAFVEEKLGREQAGKMAFNFIDRLLGHGGFASDSVTITYIDRDYAGGGLETVFRHEAAHILNRQGGGQRPSLIEEGMATYIAGGHFKEEPFEPRMVGVLALDRYIPLAQLADNFYASQHEIGYLEGAALIEYLVAEYGWDQFTVLLGAFQRAGSESAMLDGGLRVAYNKSLSTIESEWLDHLRAQPLDERWKNDAAFTIAYYDTVRRYQQAFDSSAHFLTAWVPDIARAVREDITADYDRHPSAPQNVALETMLIEVDRAIEAADFATAARYLASVNAVIASGGSFDSDALAADYLQLTLAALDAGYEPQRIHLESDSATVAASPPEQAAALVEITLTRVDGVWRVN
ncbi:MAG: hypothetical protein FJ030_19035 [Chloroflexi bacterium]|nr:hypothetical protein [Chloroflexota bacterium]